MSSGSGSAVRFYLNQSDARIGLPEVVRLETEVHLRTTIKEHIAKIKSSHQQLLAAFRRLKEVVLPTDDEIEALVQSVWTNIGVKLEPMPFTLEFATEALVRTVEKLPPSDKNQQFKDCVLWSNCLSVLATENVHLVTDDTAFYDGRDKSQGLAKSLRREIRDLPFELKIHPTLTELLSEIRTEVEVDKTTLLDAVFESRGQSIEDMTNRNSFSIGGDPDVSMDMFVTEDPTVLFVSFTLSIPCDDVSEQDRSNAKVTISGEGMYNVDDSRFVSVSTTGERLTYIDADGTEQTQANVVVTVGGAVIGHREVFHEIRFGL